MILSALLAVFFLFTGSVLPSSAAASSAAANPAGSAPDITAVSAIVADAATGAIFYEKDMHRAMYPASITKILTGLLAVERGNTQSAFAVTPTALSAMPSNAARAGLVSGEQITLDEALYTMFLASANDSANAIAIQVGGSIPNFVQMMNARAKQLGAVDSHFDNPSGLPDKNNLTSAYDMAIITRQALEEPSLMKYFGAKSYVMPATNKYPKTRAFTTLQKMMKDTAYQYDGTIAGKTGWETMSGHTLVTAAQRNGRTLICVVLRSSDGYSVYQDSIKLLNYSFTLPASYSVGSLMAPAAAQPSSSAQSTRFASSSPAVPSKAAVHTGKIAVPRDMGTTAAPILLLLFILCPFVLFLLLRRPKLAAQQPEPPRARIRPRRPPEGRP